MRIGIYSPYLDTVGGGEKYMLTIAEILSESHQVDILLDNHLQTLNSKEILEKISKFHNLNLNKLNLVNSPIGKGSIIKKSLFFKKYDWLFFNSDGSLFYSTAKNSVVHFQIPFQKLALNGLKGKVKTSSWRLAIYNSDFTREIIEKNIKLNGQTIYPPVDVENFKVDKKKKQILTVGRLVGSGVKKQSVMIEMFREMVNHKKLKDWSLHIAGAAGEGDKAYVETLETAAAGLPIIFHKNIPFLDLVKLYAESAIYWHTMGYGEDDPKKMEHFGITTVEAMASGCVPIVINKGGQKEIIKDGVSGFLWNDLQQLKALTLKVINDDGLMTKLSRQAIIRSKLFSKARFRSEIEGIVYGR